MNNNQRIQLQNMINENNVEDQTELIRKLKHSTIIKNDINNLILLKEQYRGNDEQIYIESIDKCNFLFTFYTDIFNKIRKDEIDFNILNKFLDILKSIEDGDLDQHNASFTVGTILKELYIDSALKKAKKIDELNSTSIVETKQPTLNISWKEFKKLNQTN